MVYSYSVLVVNNEFPKEQSGALLDLITYVSRLRVYQ
jgi:hypothetical protein